MCSLMSMQEVRSMDDDVVFNLVSIEISFMS